MHAYACVVQAGPLRINWNRTFKAWTKSWWRTKPTISLPRPKLKSSLSSSLRTKTRPSTRRLYRLKYYYVDPDYDYRLQGQSSKVYASWSDRMLAVIGLGTSVHRFMNSRGMHCFSQTHNRTTSPQSLDICQCQIKWMRAPAMPAKTWKWSLPQDLIALWNV